MKMIQYNLLEEDNMVNLLSRQLNHCPGHDPTAPYPSLCFLSRKRVRKNRYRKTGDCNQPHFCCGGSYREDIAITEIIRNRKTNTAKSSSSLQDNDALFTSTQGKVNMFVSPQVISPTEYRRSTTSWYLDIFNQLKHVTSHHLSWENKLYKNAFFNEWQYFGLSNEGSARTETIAPFTSLHSYFQKLAAGVELSVNDKMVFEALRLQSFHEVNTEISALILAKSGFFATGNGNETKCYSCGMTYNYWHRTDNCPQIHKRFSPNCRHVQGTDYRNVPTSGPSTPAVQSAANSVDDSRTASSSLHEISTLSSTDSVKTSQTDDTTSTDSGIVSVPQERISHDSQITATTDSNVTENTELGTSNNTTELQSSTLSAVEFREAVYPHYKETNKRLESFLTWPKNHCKKPAELVFVGFFYAGYSDCVRCFVCGVGLRTWEEEDDPWVEHVRWRSSCDFVTQVRGQRFVIQTLAALGRQTNKQSNGLLETEACRHALKMGFSEDLVTQAAQQISKSQGAGSVELHVLLERVLTLQEENSVPKESPFASGCKDKEPKQATLLDPKTETYSADATIKDTEMSTGKTTNENTDIPSLESTEEENRQMRESSFCKICLDETANIVFLPCGHLVACVTCSPALERCPLCRKHIRGTVRVHLATMTSLKATN